MGGRIAYIDNTGKHGFVITSISSESMTYYEGIKKAPKGSRVPTLRELEIIAPCAEIFKLYGTYFWSIDADPSYKSFGYCIEYMKPGKGVFITHNLLKDRYYGFIYIKDFLTM